MESDVEVGLWEAELRALLLRVGERFGRVEPRRRMRDYVRGLLGPVGRKNSWQIAEHGGHDTSYGLQRLLSWCQWDPDEIRDDLQSYVAERLGQPDGVLIVDDTGFLKKGTVSAGVQRQYSGTAEGASRARAATRPWAGSPSAATDIGTWIAPATRLRTVFGHKGAAAAETAALGGAHQTVQRPGDLPRHGDPRLPPRFRPSRNLRAGFRTRFRMRYGRLFRRSANC